MSVKIKLSYTTDEELEEVIKRLSSLVKKQPAKGKYKRAYASATITGTATKGKND